MGLRSVSLTVVVLLAAQGCTKTIYYAVLAPNQAMADQTSCFRQCQMMHSGQTKQFLSCVDTCPGSHVVKEQRCNDVAFDTEAFACTTVHNQALDGVALGLGIGVLVLVSVLVAVASSNSTTQMTP